MLTGPDVSEHQGNVDWEKVAKDHDLALVRVADGDHRDPWYTEERIRAVRKAGLLLAPYYFARVASPQNNQRDGEAEAAMVLGFAKSRGWRWPGDLPLVYDFETSNAQPNEKCARHVVQFVHAYRESESHDPAIYTMPGFWSQILPYLSRTERQLIARLSSAPGGMGGLRPEGTRSLERRRALAMDGRGKLRWGLGQGRHEPLGGRRERDPGVGETGRKARSGSRARR